MRGRIDRLDLFDKGQESYLRVIDYKSGRTEVDAEEMHAGVQLQLPAYMNVFRENFSEGSSIPAGMFYYYLDQPLPTLGQGTDLEKQIREFHKMQGMFLGEEDLIDAMDHTFKETGIADSIPAKKTKNGNIQRNRGIINREEMDVVLKENLIHIKNSVREIHEGKITIFPYRTAKRDSCKSCAYGAICQFDEAFLENTCRGTEGDQKEDCKS